MTDRKDKSDEDGFSDSSELFESLFRDEPLEEDKKAKQTPKAKPQVRPRENLSNKRQNHPTQTNHPTQKVSPPRQTLRAPRLATPTVEQAGPAPVRKSSPPKAPEIPALVGRRSTSERTVETEKAMSVKTKPSKVRRGSGSNVLKVILLVFVLAVGAGVAANYLGFVDFEEYISFFIGEKPRVAPPKVAHTRPGKKLLPQVTAKPATETHKPQTLPVHPGAGVKQIQQRSVQAGQRVGKGEAELKAHVSAQAAQAKEMPAQVKSQAPAGPVAKRETLAVAAREPVAQPKPARETTTPAHPKAELAEIAPAQQRPQPYQPQPVHVSPYPFSVYLGSFKTLDWAKTAVSIYNKESGVSAFWAKVDLGEKGIWYRVFTGYFRSAEEAEAFIRQKQLKDAEVSHTEYSTLIGEYSKKEDAEHVTRQLSELGYSPYFVTEPSGPLKLYIGAFHTMEGARRQYAELASKGIKSRAVER
jgi:SPOR domain